MKLKAESVITESGVDLESFYQSQNVHNEQLRYDRLGTVYLLPGEQKRVSGDEKVYTPLSFGEASYTLSAFNYIQVENFEDYTAIYPPISNEAYCFLRACVRVASDSIAVHYFRAEYRLKGSTENWRVNNDMEPLRIVKTEPLTIDGLTIQPHTFELSWNISGINEYEWRIAYYPRLCAPGTVVSFMGVNAEIVCAPRGIQ